MKSNLARENAVEILRRKLVFRSWHRGTKEMDLMLGRFADIHVAQMGMTQLLQFEALMHENDPDLYGWLTGHAETPERCRNEVMELMVSFYAKK
jgi:antitoxin CptB